MAYYTVISTLKNQASCFGLEQEDIGLSDINPEMDLFAVPNQLDATGRKDVLEGLLETIRSIADIDYQKRAWIREEPPGTDFNETVNHYSLDAEGILANYKDFGITEIQLVALKRFDTRFRNFYENNNWPQTFIETPEWKEIMRLATELLQDFSK